MKKEERKLSLKEIQKTEFEIMKALHCWCTKHNIKYCMGYGTLLGAVRHKGFIPWDNDMDILMPRPDFERMLKLVDLDKIAENIEILHYSKDYKYHYSVARVIDNRTKVFAKYLVEQPEKLGVWVDIFPIDGISQKGLNMKEKCGAWFYKKMQRVDLYSSEKMPILRVIKCILRKLFHNDDNYHMKMIDNYAKKYTFDESYLVADMIEAKPIKMEKRDFVEAVLLEFESAQFYAPFGWKKYLEQAYGDYMKMPKEEDRITHEINAVWKRGRVEE